MSASTPDPFGPVAKVLSGAFAILITATTTIAAATGGVAYLLLNAATPMRWALVLAAVAVLCAILATIWPAQKTNGRWFVRAALIGVSAIALGVSLGLVVNTQTRLLQQPSRPVIAVQWVTVGSGPGLQLAIDADALAVHDQLYSAVVVVGRKAPGPAGPAARTPPPGVQPSQVERFTIYAGSTGPDRNGHGKQTQQVVVPSQVEGYTIESVQIAAVVLKLATLEKLSTAAAAPNPTTSSSPPPTTSAATASPTSPPRSGNAPIPTPPPLPVPRVVSLSCDGKITTADSATGSQIRELGALEVGEPIGRPACVNLSAIPERAATTGTPKPANSR